MKKVEERKTMKKDVMIIGKIRGKGKNRWGKKIDTGRNCKGG